MRIDELYTGDFFTTGRYAPDYDKYALEVFEKAGAVVQAQTYVNLGSKVGDNKLGRTFEIISNEGGTSPRRSYYGDVESNVVGADSVTVFMGINSEKIITDKAQVRIHGTTEQNRQLSGATQRFYITFGYKLFNSDKDKIDTTDKSGKIKFDFDGYEKYFKLHTSQVENKVLSIPDIIANPNMRFEATDFLNSVHSNVNVNGMGADVIYTSRRGKAILESLESDKRKYEGEYKFTRNVSTYDGLPIVVIPDVCIPSAWKAKGEFVLFSNQNENDGNRIMVPTNGGLITSYASVSTGFQDVIPMDMIFAAVLINPKAASLCFMNRVASVSEVKA